MRRVPVGRALVVALALGGALGVPFPLSAVPTPSGCAIAGPCLAVHLPDGSITDVSSSTLTGWAAVAVADNAPNEVVNPQDYPQRDPAGQSVDPRTVNGGLSVNALLADLGVDVSTVTFTQMSQSDGTWSTLSADELSGAPTVFQDASLLPAFYSPAGQDQMLYARPLRNATDSNLADNAIASPPNGALDLFVHTGRLLSVKEKAIVNTTTVVTSTTVIKRNQPISFTASSNDGAVAIKYRWILNDGAQISRQQDFTYSFAAAGLYEVQVSAAGADDSAGASAPLYIQVGPAKYRGTPSPGTSSSPTPRATPTPTPIATATPTPATTSHSGPASTSTPAVGGSTGGRSSGPSPAAPAAPSQHPNVVTADGLPVIRGRLIGSSLSLLSASGSVLDQSTVGVAPVARASVGWRAAGLVAAIAAIMLLFAAGAVRELRWSRRLRSVVRPR
jgi:PKD domain